MPTMSSARKLAGKFRQIPGSSDVVVQQPMGMPTLLGRIRPQVRARR